MTDKCEDAETNPNCPYLTQIRQQGSDIKMIKKALIGEDMQSGLVAEVHKFKALYKVMIFVAGVCVTTLVAILFKTALQM